MRELKYVKTAAEHVARGQELLDELLAVKSFEEQGLIEAESAADEVVSLAKRFELEMGHACASLKQLAKSSENGHYKS